MCFRICPTELIFLVIFSGGFLNMSASYVLSFWQSQKNYYVGNIRQLPLPWGSDRVAASKTHGRPCFCWYNTMIVLFWNRESLKLFCPALCRTPVYLEIRTEDLRSTYQLFRGADDRNVLRKKTLSHRGQRRRGWTEVFYCKAVCQLVFRDCMKGDETENKKIGCTVNLLVRFRWRWCPAHRPADFHQKFIVTICRSFSTSLYLVGLIN